MIIQTKSPHLIQYIVEIYRFKENQNLSTTSLKPITLGPQCEEGAWGISNRLKGFPISFASLF